MATKAFKALTEKDQHTVGNINSSSLYVKDIPNGVKFKADTDNFTLVELSFEDGERVASALSAVTKQGYLVASPERRYLDEDINAFYVGAGERGRVIHLDKGIRFETSAYTLNDGVDELEVGLSAHFDPTTKKFIIHDGTHASFATAVNQFVVVTGQADVRYTLGQAMVRLEVVK